MNQLAFPGLGTIMAGLRVGYLQASIMVPGFVLATGFMLWFILCSARYLASSTWDEGRYVAEYRPYAWMGKLGLALCILAWCWSLVSSIGILCQARKTPPALPVT